MRDKDKDKASEREAAKITHQARTRSGGMAYDLKCEGVRLSLRVSPRSNDGDLGEWCVEARTGRPSDEAVVVAEWGPTKIDALRSVGRAWTLQPLALALPAFDWDAVAKALLAVRAV